MNECDVRKGITHVARSSLDFGVVSADVGVVDDVSSVGVDFRAVALIRDEDIGALEMLRARASFLKFFNCS